MDKMKFSASKASIKILKADEPEKSCAGFDINDELLPDIEKKKNYTLDICNKETEKSACAPSNVSSSVSENFDKESRSKLNVMHLESFAGFDINDAMLSDIKKKKKYILDISNKEIRNSIIAYTPSNVSSSVSKNFDEESQSKLNVIRLESFVGFDINDAILPDIEKKKKYILDICNKERGNSIEACTPSNISSSVSNKETEESIEACTPSHCSSSVSKNFDEKSQSKLQERPTVFMKSFNYMVTSMRHVFKYLSMDELIAASQVSVAWNIFAMDKELWETIRLKNCKVIDWEKFIEVINYHDSVALDTRHMIMPKEIEELKTFWSTFTLAINKAKKLKNIELYRCSAYVVEQTIKSLTQLTVLNATSIKNPTVENDNESEMLMTLDLNYLCHMVQLSELRLKGLNGINLTHLPSFEKLVNLRYLAITSIESFPNNICRSLETITTDLVYFEIGDCCCLPNDFAGVLKRFSNLISLRLEKFFGIRENDVQAIFCSIRALDKLKILELY